MTRAEFNGKLYDLLRERFGDSDWALEARERIETAMHDALDGVLEDIEKEERDR